MAAIFTDGGQGMMDLFVSEGARLARAHPDKTVAEIVELFNLETARLLEQRRRERYCCVEGCGNGVIYRRRLSSNPPEKAVVLGWCYDHYWAVNSGVEGEEIRTITCL